MRQPNLFKKFAEANRFTCLYMLASLTGSALAQSSIMVSHEDEWLTVVAMDKETPLAFVGSELTRFPDGQLALQTPGRYADGAIHFHSKNAQLFVRRETYFLLEGNASIDRDFENCFILLLIEPDSGLPTKIVSEIPDIIADNGSQFSIILPINPLFSGADYTYRLYSGGEEILITDENDKSARSPTNSLSTTAGSPTPGPNYELQATPPSAAEEYPLEFPASLKGVLEGGYTEAIYRIDSQGQVSELLHLHSDHTELIPPTLATIIKTRYRPGTLNDTPAPTTIKQRFFFNEFACFPEQMLLISYPTLKDRNATLVYKPQENAPSDNSQKTRVRFTVDKLGRPTLPRNVDPEAPPLSPETIAYLESCIFLPAIKEGLPSEQEISTRISAR